MISTEQNSGKGNSKIIFLFFFFLIFFYWKSGYNFFWRDDWQFLSDFRNVDIKYFFAPIGGPIIPLFKMIYYAELNLFGINCGWYQYVNLFIFTLQIMVMFKIVSLYESNIKVCFALCVFAIVLPNNFHHLLWSFLVGVTLHLLFQAISFYYLIRFLQKDIRKYFYLSIVFLILQNYTYGNGILLPLVFLFALIIYGKFKNYKLEFVLTVLLFFFFVLIQYCFAPAVDSSLISSLPSIVKTYFLFIGTSAARLFFFSEKIFGGATSYFALLILFSLIGIGYSNRKTDKKLLSTYLFWFLIVSVAIPIARHEHIEDIGNFQNYYSTLCFMPLLLMVHLIVRDWRFKILFFKKYQKYFLYVIIILILGITFIIDNKIGNSFTIINLRNEANMNIAIRENKVYYGFLDGYFSEKEYRIKDPKEIYLYWKNKTAAVSLGMKKTSND